MKSVYKTARLDVNLHAGFQISGKARLSLAEYLAFQVLRITCPKKNNYDILTRFVLESEDIT